VFEAVARHGSVTRAAEELHLAQPTVSTQLGKLSETVGLKLHEHQNRTLRLTPAGREVRAACEELMALLERTEARLAGLRAPREEMLRLAAAPGARHLAARLLAAFCARHPGVRVGLHVAERRLLVERLLAGEDDLSLLAPGEDHSGIATLPAATELMHVYAAARHPLVRARSIPMQSVAAEPMVVREPGSSSRAMLFAIFSAHGAQPSVRAELASNEAVAEAVAAGLGLGLLPEGEAQALARGGAIAPLEAQGFPLKREWCIARADGRGLSRAAELFLRQATQLLTADPTAGVWISRTGSPVEKQIPHTDLTA
jgi:LysR family transcriptional regulator, low CO2-responsive transcriptional regulator